MTETTFQFIQAGKANTYFCIVKSPKKFLEKNEDFFH